MSAAAQELLAKYQSLSEEDRYEVSVAILRDLPDYGEIPQEAMDELTNEMFLGLDRAEAADGKPTY